MRSQFRFVMHPDDERDFAARVLSEASVVLIDGPRWRAPEPTTYRSLSDVKGSYCIIWSPQDRMSLYARQLPGGDTWYCEAESFTIQFLRSQIFGSVITEGRLAVGTSGLVGELGVEQRFKALVRYAKKHYTNSTVRWVNPTLPLAPATKDRSANPGKPDAQVWLAPHALRWLQTESSRCVKQFTNSVVEARLVDAT
jgi:hypothetical protein